VCQSVFLLDPLRLSPGVIFPYWCSSRGAEGSRVRPDWSVIVLDANHFVFSFVYWFPLFDQRWSLVPLCTSTRDLFKSVTYAFSCLDYSFEACAFDFFL